MWKRLALAVRGVKVVGNLSVLPLLALPLVSLSMCGTSIARVTGYDAIQGVTVTPSTDYTIPARFLHFGPDWWVVGVIIAALIGAASAVRAGVTGSAIGLGAAVAGLVAITAAINFYTPPSASPVGWTPEAADAGSGISLIFFGAGVLELSYMSARSWHEVRRNRTEPNWQVGEWTALGCFSTSFLILIALAAAALAIFVLLGHLR